MPIPRVGDARLACRSVRRGDTTSVWHRGPAPRTAAVHSMPAPGGQPESCGGEAGATVAVGDVVGVAVGGRRPRTIPSSSVMAGAR